MRSSIRRAPKLKGKSITNAIFKITRVRIGEIEYLLPKLRADYTPNEAVVEVVIVQS